MFKKTSQNKFHHNKSLACGNPPAHQCRPNALRNGKCHKVVKPKKKGGMCMRGWDGTAESGTARALLRTPRGFKGRCQPPICPLLGSQGRKVGAPTLPLGRDEDSFAPCCLRTTDCHRSPKGMPPECKSSSQRPFHFPYPCWIKSYLTVVKSRGSGEATQVSTISLRLGSVLWSVAWRKTSFL